MLAISLLVICCTTVATKIRADIDHGLSPSRRQARSIAFADILNLAPLFTLNNVDPLSNQLLRDVPIPPPPAAPPSDSAAATQTRPSNGIQSLLPLLSFARMLGGSLGSSEHSLLNTLYLSQLLTSQSGRPGILAPPVSRDVPEPTTAGPNVKTASKLEGPEFAAPPGPGAEKASRRCEINQTHSACSDVPYNKILTIDGHILAINGERVYKLLADGSPAQSAPISFDPMLRNISATANIRGAEYIFQGSHYYKLNEANNDQPRVRLVEDGFPGIPVPVEGVFQLDSRTFVFISGIQFSYYQPESNPPVNSNFSPQFLGNVPGAPEKVDSVFTAGDSVFLYRRGILYEIDPGRMVIQRELPLVTGKEAGWLKCPAQTMEQQVDCQKPSKIIEGSKNERNVSKRVNGP